MPAPYDTMLNLDLDADDPYSAQMQAYNRNNPTPAYSEPQRHDSPFGNEYAVPEYTSVQVEPEYTAPYPDTDYSEKQEFDTRSEYNLGQTLLPTATFGEYDGNSYDGLSQHSDDEENEKVYNPHFGPAPNTQLRRNRTKKRVPLTNGALIMEAPIPSRLKTFLPRKNEEEFEKMRYSAVTCDPDDFESQHYTVRPAIYNRETELLIGVTMYNEDEVLLCRTLHGVMKNIAHLCTREKSRVWGKDGWKKVVVCIVADGRKATHPRVLDVLAAMGVYQHGVAKNVVNNKEVQAHVYEYTSQLSIDADLKFKGLEKGIVPTQFIFCLKEKNAKKINSHRWLFNAFAPLLQPNICVLIDVGTKPGPKSLYHLWKAFDMNSNVAGACGEISTMKGKFWTGLLNPLVAAQNFEYKMSNILDKPTESAFGYISVLPGAFSAYRYIALLNDDLGQGPLASYFKGETLAGHDADIFTANMYLAEDRILCWELVAKRGDAWVLKYVKQAQGETDVPDSACEFINQRRRWLNGSFFAAVYSVAHLFQIQRTSHTPWKKAILYLESIYNALNLLLAWFGVACFYVFFVILTQSLEAPNFGFGKWVKPINTIIHYWYSGTLIATFLLSMGNRPSGAKWKYMTVIVSYSVLCAYMMGCAIYCIYIAVTNIGSSTVFAQIIISMSATYGVYVISSVLALDPWHILTCMGQYLILSPVYINLLNIYAFCNIDDVSWGSKGLDVASKDLGVAAAAGADAVEVVLPSAQADIDVGYDDALHSLRTRPKLLPKLKSASEKERMKIDYYSSMRTNVVLAWTMSNGLLASIILSGNTTDTFSGNTTRTSVFMLVVLVFVAITAIIRLCGSTLYLIMRMING